MNGESSIVGDFVLKDQKLYVYGCIKCRVMIFVVLSASRGELLLSRSSRDFNKLCKIFNEIAPKEISPALKLMELSGRI